MPALDSKFMVPWKHLRFVSRQNALRGALCFVFLFTACGRNQTAPVSEGSENAASKTAVHEAPLNLQIEQKLDPLTRDDVELYLSVMRAAAERVKSPTPGDLATLSAAQTILARHSTSPTPDDANTLQRATLIATAMDQIVAEDRKLDGRTYRGIAEAVEAAVPNASISAAAAAPVPGSASTPLQVRLFDVNASNRAFLAPYRDEVQALLATVRNPGNLPR